MRPPDADGGDTTRTSSASHGHLRHAPPASHTHSRAAPARTVETPNDTQGTTPSVHAARRTGRTLGRAPSRRHSFRDVVFNDLAGDSCWVAVVSHPDRLEGVAEVGW